MPIPAWLSGFLESKDGKDAKGRLLVLAVTDEDVILQYNPRKKMKNADKKQLHEIATNLLDKWYKSPRT